LYTLTGADQRNATLALATPQAAGAVTVTLVVSNGTSSDSATRTITHAPASTSQWFDLGPVATQARTLTTGDQVSIRTVDANGQDAYWPSTPVTITAGNTSASAWPLALAQAVNAGSGPVRIGVLNGSDEVVPEASATANRIYAQMSANIVSAFLQVESTPPPDSSITVTTAVPSNSPWFTELQLNLANTQTITALTATIEVQKTSGVSFSGQYNTVGGTIEQTSATTASTITYSFTLSPGATLTAGTGRRFVAQVGGGGTTHPTAGDTYTVTYTVGGVSYTRTGTF
ncbi:MAG: hypothetical protein AAFV29_19140, partial [Myxococcota bacterium]